MHVKHAALLKLKHAALFLILQLVLVLIMLRVLIMLPPCFNIAACRFSTCKFTPDNFPATKKDRTRFSHTLSLHYFLSAFGDIMQTENNGFG